MNKGIGSFDDFLAEITASLTGNSGDVSLRRINTERVLKLALDEIVKQRHDVQIRVLNDHRISGETGADILVQIDDYDIRLEILDTANDSCQVSIEQISQFQNIFEENPSTETLILTWTTSELLSIQFTLSELDSLKIFDKEIIQFTDTARPLVEVINEVLESRIKVWEKILTPPQENEVSGTDIRNLFNNHFSICLKEEQNRSYKINEKKLAAEKLSKKEAVTLFNGVLDQALTGESTEILATRLSQLPKRSSK